jgi:superfamily II DNA or RNA helicase
MAGNLDSHARRRRRAHHAVEGPKLSHLRRPSGMAVDEWQRGLRRQFGRVQAFKWKNLGAEPIFSEFAVENPQSGSRYRVAIRGIRPGENFCSCPDFSTNDLGTCKHIEFVLGRLERKRGGRRSLAQGFKPRYSEVYLQYGAGRHVRFRAGLDCPPPLARRAARLFRGPPAGVLPAAQVSALQSFLAQAQRCEHEVRCYEDVLGFVAQIRDAEERRKIIDSAYSEGGVSPALRKLLKAELYPYQADGALFAVRAGRCLIGDEMGLGKTIQAIAAAELFARHFGAERVLVVCPTSLKHQWQREIARFTGRPSQVISGLRAAREAQYAQQFFCKITNYDVLSKDLDLIGRWSPDVLIVDEAQRVKNWNTVAARALKRIETPYAIVLTGTPLENRLEELVSIVQFVDRHRLGPTWRLRHEHQTVDEAGRVIGYRGLDRIGKTLEPVLLRRRKAEVLSQLPPRMDKTLFVAMTEEQMRHHEENAEIVDRIVSRWRKTGFLSDADQRRLTCALQNMRMSCNSTYLLDKRTDHGAKADELVTILEELFERPEAKAVIFSSWIATHELIIRRLKRKRWGHVLFHGSVPGTQRGALVDRFREDPGCRVFLSTDAGGVGLNLQDAASTIINMDLPWNPAVLEQRIGRVHRLGQAHGVNVVNFVAEGTIEQRMLSLLAFKKSLFAGVLDGGDSEVFLGGTRLSKFMESVEAVARTANAEAPPAPVREASSVRRRTQAGSTAESGADAAVSRFSNTPVPAAERQLAAATRDTGAPPRSSAPEPQSGTSGPGGPSEPVQNPWAPLLQAGLELAKVLSAASNGGTAAAPASNAMPSWVEKDARTGRGYLRLPLPDPGAVQALATALSKLMESIAR